MAYGETTSPQIETIVTKIMDAAFEVHRALGPGLLESVYETCMVHALAKRGLRVCRQVEVPILFDGLKIASGLVLDLLIEDTVIIELKAVEKHNPLYEAQLLTYMKLANQKIGLLINFNVPRLRDGFKRMVL